MDKTQLNNENSVRELSDTELEDVSGGFLYPAYILGEICYHAGRKVYYDYKNAQLQRKIRVMNASSRR